MGEVLMQLFLCSVLYQRAWRYSYPSTFFTKIRSPELSHIKWLEGEKKAHIRKMDNAISLPESYSPTRILRGQILNNCPTNFEINLPFKYFLNSAK